MDKMGHLATLLLPNATKTKCHLFSKQKFKLARGGDHRVLKIGMKIVMLYRRHDAKSAALNMNCASYHPDFVL